MPRTLSLDLETCCGADLRKVGASKYSKDPSLIVTVIAWAFDDGPVASTTCVESGERVLPAVVEDHLRRGGRFNAWNASFESAMLVNYFGVPIAPEQVSCTMQRALHAGLPGALGDCGPALGLSIVKDKSAHRLMMQMARPKLKGGYWHETNPEKLAALRAYCERDVDAEREIAKHVPELPAREELISQIDRAANQRGLRISIPLVERMLEIANEATEALDGQVEILTDGEVISSGTNPARMMAWLNGQGCPIDSLTKGAVSAWLLRNDLTPEVRRVLELRQMAARSSVKKLVAMLNAAEEDDDAVRGALAYYGASRTGRWSGRLVQPQNFPRPSIKKPNEAIDFVLRGGNAEGLGSMFGDPLSVVASCLRGCIVPRRGKKFIAFDLSQIEARMVAWLAGQQDILDVFARGDDVYTHTAKKVGLKSRQEGKVAVLGLGYGMGASKFIDTAKTYGLTFDAEGAERVVRDWRDANPHIVKLWWAADRKVRECIEAAAASTTKQAAREINGWLSVDVRPAKNGSPLLTMMLPSGRRLYYRDIALEAEDAAQIEYERREIEQAFLADEIEGPDAIRMLAELDQREPGKMSITYSGVHQITKRWTKIRTYGGKLVENATQAAARDVVCDMAIKIDAAQLGDLVLSVHDELIYEVPEDEAEARFRAIEKIVNTTPDWAPGLPVAAEGAIMDRYGK